MMTAKKIADDLIAVSEQYQTLSVEEICAETEILWAEAKKCRFTFRRVDQILQQHSLAEMEEAINETT